ncbi:hypothetical protein BDK51DRAFT_25610 [Blyttiomyces helicus]|uniref:NAD(P)-binding domain-containing protein n=1 Tax=Blyttiomyces helicus TaxID=388810 RepID=A0A4V1ISG5_9FUNG|nr:hypothetical protein BDK51DRAFT_25610 [Blyttiomyces helicus]|eukprot:RKO93477.1 hypothetical protein BDK51DRAFT_25610 [Blyttiomyces helicus]
MSSTTSTPIKLILTGATGTAGSEVLRQALVHPKIERVTVLSRRPLPPHVAPTGGSHPKHNVVIHENYESYPPELLKHVEGHDAVVWAQGISAVGFKEDAYMVITHDYPVAAAKAFATLKPAGGDKKLVFACLSGRGTRRDGKSSQLFARMKLALANLPLTLPSLETYSFRPGGIVNTQPVPQAGMLQKAMSLLGPVVGPLMKKSMISTPDLANGMIEAVVRASAGTLRTEWPGKGDLGDENAFSNEEIKKLAQYGQFATKY